MYRTRKFDDRAVDFHSGKKVSPPMAERRVCDCCGLRLVKGWIMSNGMPVGEDCEHIISSARLSNAISADEFQTEYLRATGWTLKPMIRQYLAANVYA